jgi:hypothetical protein
MGPGPLSPAPPTTLTRTSPSTLPTRRPHYKCCSPCPQDYVLCASTQVSRHMDVRELPSLPSEGIQCSLTSRVRIIDGFILLERVE